MTQPDPAQSGGTPQWQQTTYAGNQYNQDFNADLNADKTASGSGWLAPIVDDLQAMGQAATQANAANAQNMTKAQHDGLGTHHGPNSAGTCYHHIDPNRLYQMTQQNIDPSDVGDHGRTFNELGNAYVDAANDAMKIVSYSQLDWSGTTADQFHGALGAMAEWHGSVAEGMQAVGAQFYSQSEAVSKVKNSTTPPPAFNSTTAIQSLVFGGPAAFTQNIQQQATTMNNAHNANITHVSTYEGSLSQINATTPAFTAPPKNVNPNSLPPGGGVNVPGVGGTTHPASTIRSGTGGSARLRGTGSGTGGMTPRGVSNSGRYSGTPIVSQPYNYSPGKTSTSDYNDPNAHGGASGSGTADGTAPGAGDIGGTAMMPMGGMPMGGGFGGGADQTRNAKAYGGGLGGTNGDIASRLAGGDSGSSSGSGGTSGIGASVADQDALRSGVAGPAGGTTGTTPGMMGGAGAGRGGKKEEDKEHKSSPILQSDELEQAITGKMEKTVPPVIGDPGK